jgi:hypothetical protein
MQKRQRCAEEAKMESECDSDCDCDQDPEEDFDDAEFGDLIFVEEEW